jgi:serine phosphatase RsbU (regulator of sigma subunit)/anti-sigma regulatory factor (Ser/Thr protein kinase)
LWASSVPGDSDATLVTVSAGTTTGDESGDLATRRDLSCLELEDRPDAVRAGRRFVCDELTTAGATGDLVDDAALVVAELLANAVQHGMPPIVVCVRAARERARLEVHDGSARTPVRVAASTTNMTGRGLTLVDALVSEWGVDRLPSGGKSVWCELVPGTQSPTAPADADVDAMLAAWEDEPATAEERYTVVLGDVPTGLLLTAKAHIDNLVREFSLAASGGMAGGPGIPEPLADLIETVVHGFADARIAIKQQALAASHRGDPRTLLTLHLPLSAAAAGEAYLAALDEADEYARAARLLTLETPADHRLFRRWYVEAVVDQLRDLGAGRRPPPVTPFEEYLVGEVRRLAKAERAGIRASRLQRATAALARTRTPQDVAGVVISEGVAALGASGGGLLVPAGDGVHIAVPGVVGYGEQLAAALRSERLDAPLPAATALRTGEAIWIESQEERDRRFPVLRGFEEATVAMCAVPLFVGDRLLGALRFSFSSGKLFDDDERSFVLALAALTAQTLQRTELYESERQATLELQRALLPQLVSGVPGWDVAAHYSPAGGQEAGGDFYDVIPLPDGRFAAIVGDVMGRGLEAAAAMAQVRSTIRAYAIDDPDPAAVFSRIDEFFSVLELEQLVTALYMLVDSGGNTVQIGSAGHLPPLLVTPGDCSVVPIEAGLPFGVASDVRTVTTIDLPVGASVVAITDGLVERRGEDIDEGVDRLREACKSAGALDANALLHLIVASSSAERTHDDDVTVLVLRKA